MIHRKIIFSALTIACVFLFACGTTHPEPRYYSPEHALYEKAATLGKGHSEIAAHYTNSRLLGPNAYSQTYGNAFAENFGLRLGYGFSDKVDVKLRYEYAGIPDRTYNPDPQFNTIAKRNYFFSLIPKVNFIPEKLSLVVPLGFYDYES